MDRSMAVPDMSVAAPLFTIIICCLVTISSIFLPLIRVLLLSPHRQLWALKFPSSSTGFGTSAMILFFFTSAMSTASGALLI